MVALVAYAIAVAAAIWYTLFYLPFPLLASHFAFALNIFQLGLLSLLSFMAYRQELHYKNVFYQFWIIFAALGLTAPVIYHCWHVWGDVGGLKAFVVTSIVIHGLFLWGSVKIVSTYIFRDEKRWAINLLSSVVVLPLCLWFTWPYFWDPGAILSLPTASDPALIYLPIEVAAIRLNVLSLVILLAFFVHKLRTDRPIGAYADTLFAFYGVFLAVDTAEYLTHGTTVEYQTITQWASGLILAGMTVTLLLRLKYKSQTIAQYYESQCISHDPRIDRRIGVFDRLILWSFFDPEKVGERVYLGTGSAKMKVKRTSARISRPESK